MVVLCWQRKRINMYRASDTLYVLFSTILKQAYGKGIIFPIFQIRKQTQRC